MGPRSSTPICPVELAIREARRKVWDSTHPVDRARELCGAVPHDPTNPTAATNCGPPDCRWTPGGWTGRRLPRVSRP